MMQCPMQTGESAGLLLDYCARRLAPNQSVLIEKHLEACADCRNLVGAQQLLWETIDSWEVGDVSPDFNRRLYARIAGDEQRNFLQRCLDTVLARWTPLSWKPIASVAAASVILVAALFINGPEHNSKDPQAVRAEIEQAERAFQDLEMLQQLSPQVAPEAGAQDSL